MKKLLFTLILAIICDISAFAYDFSAVCESGQTLYYNITSNTYTVELIHQNISEPYYDINPVGNLVIPENVTFNDVIYSVTSIADSTFYNCSELTSVIIPNSVIRIGNMAFGNCRGLVSVTIPESVERIDNWAFRDCRVLATVNFNATNCTIMGSEGYPVFQNCYANTTINIGNSVTIIPHYAFMHAKGNGALYIPNSVTYIGNWAFYDCNRFTSVVIGSSVSEIGSYAFLNCSNLESIMVDTENNVYDSRDNCNAVIETSTNNLVVGCRNSIIPSSVTSIGEFAFQNCRLTSVFIPNSVTRIGEGAFDSCIELAEVNMGDSVIDIGDFAFAGCNGLTNLTMSNSVVNIGNNAFSTCYNLISVTLPNSLESIGDYAFQLCSGIISLTIPNSVTNIGEWAFYDCTGLTSVMISNSITEIKRSTFENCRGLTSFAIPNSVNNIGEYAFKNCSSITTLVIPDSITEIVWGAFEGCSGLTSVSIGSSVTSIGRYAFYNCNEIDTMYSYAINPPTISNTTFNGYFAVIVPCEAEENYLTANYWRSLNINGDYPYLLTAVSFDEEMGGAEIIRQGCSSAVIAAVPNEGYAFLEWEDGNNDNPRTVEIISDTTFTAVFATARNITIESSNNEMGYVTGSGLYAEGAVVEITAIPYEGYRFDHWIDADNPTRDFNTDNPRTIVASTDVTYMAVFADVTSIEENVSQDISLFPNPATDLLNITSSETISEIEIVNVMGQVVKRIEVNSDNAVCNVEDLKAGVYVVRIYSRPFGSAQGAALRRFVKE